MPVSASNLGAKRFFICGCALHDQPNHKNLLSAKLIKEACTKPRYRLHSVSDGLYPGIYEVESGGIAIPGEVYELTPQQYRNLLTKEPADLYEGRVILEDGEVISAMLYPRELIEKYGWPDISHFGGWTTYKQGSC